MPSSAKHDEQHASPAQLASVWEAADANDGFETSESKSRETDVAGSACGSVNESGGGGRTTCKFGRQSVAVEEVRGGGITVKL